MESRRALLTALTLTTKATARSPNSGCISSSDNPSPSLIGNSRSSFSIPVWRSSHSRSADFMSDRDAMTSSIGALVSIAFRLRGSVALLAAILLSACGALPTQVDRTFSQTQRPSAGSPLVRIAQDSSPDPTLTGFRLMPDGFYSLDARIQLARRARDSLDVQYYLIQDDRTGRLLMRNLRDAAMRGVRVRLLVDDLYTAGADPMFRGLAVFPNVEVRL